MTGAGKAKPGYNWRHQDVPAAKCELKRWNGQPCRAWASWRSVNYPKRACPYHFKQHQQPKLALVTTGANSLHRLVRMILDEPITERIRKRKQNPELKDLDRQLAGIDEAQHAIESRMSVGKAYSKDDIRLWNNWAALAREKADILGKQVDILIKGRYVLTPEEYTLRTQLLANAFNRIFQHCAHCGEDLEGMRIDFQNELRRISGELAAPVLADKT